MITKDGNLLVKIIKKAVGLPTSDSRCGCSRPAPAASDCCAAEATEASTAECNCDGNAALQVDEQPRQS
jgi:hypothetical protein